MIKYKKISKETKEQLKKLPDVIENERDIEAAYLFGSFGAGKAGALSDIDIAVLLSQNIASGKYNDFYLKLLEKFERSLFTGEIDLVILNEAPVLLRSNILSKGKLIYCRNEVLLTSFIGEATSKYLDTKPLYREYFQYMSERIRKREISDHRSRSYQQSLGAVRELYQQAKAPKSA